MPASARTERTAASFPSARTVVRTRWPCARSWTMQWLAMKPEPPVTRIRFWVMVRLRSLLPRVMEVVALVEIGDETRLGRLPPKQLASQRARCRRVDRQERPEPAEVRASVLWRDGDDGEIEVPADHLGDGADRHPLVGDGVQRRSRRRGFQRQAEQVRGIKAVDG